MGKKDDEVIKELTEQIRGLLANYDPALVTVVMDREISRSELAHAEMGTHAHSHSHTGGRKE